MSFLFIRFHSFRYFKLWCFCSGPPTWAFLAQLYFSSIRFKSFALNIFAEPWDFTFVLKPRIIFSIYIFSYPGSSSNPPYCPFIIQLPKHVNKFFSYPIIIRELTVCTNFTHFDGVSFIVWILLHRIYIDAKIPLSPEGTYEHLYNAIVATNGPTHFCDVCPLDITTSSSRAIFLSAADGNVFMNYLKIFIWNQGSLIFHSLYVEFDSLNFDWEIHSNNQKFSFHP